MRALDLSSQSGRQDTQHEDTDLVTLSSLAGLTGFPVEYIKKELLLEGDFISMKDLRSTMLTYLNKTMEGVLS